MVGVPLRVFTRRVTVTNGSSHDDSDASSIKGMLMSSQFNNVWEKDVGEATT